MVKLPLENPAGVTWIVNLFSLYVPAMDWQFIQRVTKHWPHHSWEMLQQVTFLPTSWQNSVTWYETWISLNAKKKNGSKREQKQVEKVQIKFKNVFLKSQHVVQSSLPQSPKKSWTQNDYIEQKRLFNQSLQWHININSIDIRGVFTAHLTLSRGTLARRDTVIEKHWYYFKTE